MKALDRDMIGVCMTSIPGAVPANNELPFVFDAATRSSKRAINQTSGGLTPFQAYSL